MFSLNLKVSYKNKQSRSGPTLTENNETKKLRNKETRKQINGETKRVKKKAEKP